MGSSIFERRSWYPDKGSVRPKSVGFPLLAKIGKGIPYDLNGMPFF